MPTLNSNTQGEELVLDYQFFAETPVKELINAATGNNQQQASTQQAPIGYPGNKVDSALITSILNGTADNNQPIEQAQQASTEPTQDQNNDTPPQNGPADPYEKRFKDAQAWGTKTSQENAQLKSEKEILAQQSQQLQQQLQQLQQQLQGIVSPQQTQQQPDISSLDPQSFMDQFMQNPQTVLQELIVKNIKPLEEKVNPVIETVNNRTMQDKWDNAVNNFYQSNPDMNDYKEQMSQFLDENRWDGAKDPEKLLTNALFYAKGVKNQPQNIDPKSYLQDQQFVNDNILNNPEIVNQILKNTAQNMQTGQPPISIPSNGGGAQIATPVEKPSTIEQMKNQVRSIFGGNNG